MTIQFDLKSSKAAEDGDSDREYFTYEEEDAVDDAGNLRDFIASDDEDVFSRKSRRTERVASPVSER